ncbi:hypothetical protein [Natronobacterium haloterrestre]|uniref:hypothetical protein n=1 Tax=Natronobacterium haloterrestre TaxID=148448 RepID=UPI001FE18397|nr:hypothetical protein [Halobiforma haloterrestris]
MQGFTTTASAYDYYVAETGIHAARGVTRRLHARTLHRPLAGHGDVERRRSGHELVGEPPTDSLESATLHRPLPESFVADSRPRSRRRRRGCCE